MAPTQYPRFGVIAPGDAKPAGADQDPVAGDDPLLRAQATAQGQPFLERLHGPHPLKQGREVIVPLHIAGQGSSPQRILCRRRARAAAHALKERQFGVI